jgi:hypothetical protein
MKLSKKSFLIIILSVVILVFIVGALRSFYSALFEKFRYENVKGIGTVLAVYADEFDTLPPLDRWCDKLIEKADCGYALNENLNGLIFSGLEAKVVLAFEAKGSWNLHGGSELMKASKQKKIAVVFVDGLMKFVKPEDIDKLKWKP